MRAPGVRQVLYLGLVADFCRAVVQQGDLGAYVALWHAAATHPGVVLQAYVQVPVRRVFTCGWFAQS